MRPVTLDLADDVFDKGWEPIFDGQPGVNLLREADKGPGGASYIAIRNPKRPAHPKKATQGGGFLSPPFPVKPFDYIRVRFDAYNSATAYWAIWFYDEHGEAIACDHTSQVPPEAAWKERAFCFRVKREAKTARFALVQMKRGTTRLANIRLDGVSRETAWAWAESVYRTLPKYTLKPDRKAGHRIPKAVKKLLAGKELKIAVLGDSWSNDLCNAPIDLAIEAAVPGSKVKAWTTGAGSLGWKRVLAETDLLGPRLLDVKADVLAFNSTSNDPDACRGPLGELVERVRARTSMEPILVTNHGGWSRIRGRARKKAAATLETAERLGCEAIDLQGAFEEMLTRTGSGVDLILRDSNHLNHRGRAFAARVVATHFRQAVANAR